MTQYFMDITTDLLNEIFTNQMFEVFSMTFLLCAGLGIFHFIRKSLYN